jgi:hypothetical protein
MSPEVVHEAKRISAMQVNAVAARVAETDIPIVSMQWKLAATAGYSEWLPIQQ